MKILYISLKADFGKNGDESQGYSYEYSHLWDAWAWHVLRGNRDDLFVDAWWSDQDHPDKLRAMIESDQYDLIFNLPVTWVHDAPWELLDLAVKKGIPVVEFDCDPAYRFDNPTSPWILERHKRGLVTHFLCPSPHVLPRYEAHGMKVREMTYGCPTWIDRDVSVDQDIDVSLVGQKHGIRQGVIDRLRAEGIRVECFGRFWPDHPHSYPFLTESEINNVFNRSKVNLNLTWISQPPHYHQIKGRHFELVGAGACQVATYGAEEMQGLDKYMTEGIDFVQVYSEDDLVEAVKRLLDNPLEREYYRKACYERRQENLYTTRLEEFLETWGTW